MILVLYVDYPEHSFVGVHMIWQFVVLLSNIFCHQKLKDSALEKKLDETIGKFHEGDVVSLV